MVHMAIAALEVVTIFFFGANLVQASSPVDNREGSDPWQFQVNLYGWLPDAPATINVNGQEVVDVPEDLDTILDSLDSAAMFELQARKGKITLFANTVYYEGSYGEKFTGPISSAARNMSLEEEVFAIKYGVGYELGSWDLGEGSNATTVTLTPWAGAFFFKDNYSVILKPTGELPGTELSGTVRYNTPMVGFASHAEFSDRWFGDLSYGYGGWKVSNVDRTWDAILNVGYRFKMGNISSKVFAGYRYLYIDYQKGATELELDARGPYIGLGWDF